MENILAVERCLKKIGYDRKFTWYRRTENKYKYKEWHTLVYTAAKEGGDSSYWGKTTDTKYSVRLSELHVVVPSVPL